MRIKKENDFDSCKASLHYLRQEKILNDIDKARNKLITEDLISKIENLDMREKIAIAGALQLSFFKKENNVVLDLFKDEWSELDVLAGKKKRQKDVGIVTVLERELRAVLIALGRSADEKEDYICNNGRSYWFSEIENEENEMINVVVTRVGEPRNVPCAIAVEQLLNMFDLKIVVFSGIAAGPRKIVSLGDVVYATKIYDYEHARLEIAKYFGIPFYFKRRKLPRPEFGKVEHKVRIALDKFDQPERIEKYQKDFLDKLNRLHQGEIPEALRKPEENKPKVYDGTIVAGEKLIADGSLKKLYKIADEKIRAASQEDSGFFQAAKSKKIPWAVFRGISDYGDHRKNRGWHTVASLSAALCATHFIKSINLAKID